MKTILLPVLMLVILTGANAQGASNAVAEPVQGHVSFAELLKQQHGDVQRHGNARALVYKEIGYEKEFWSNPTSTWVPNDSFTYSYTTSGNIEGSVEVAANNWGPYQKEAYTYDGSGNKTNYLLQEWINYLSTYRNKSQHAYTYDASGNNTLEIDQVWDTVNNWINIYKYISVFDANHNKTDNIFQTWQTGTASWGNYWHYITTYNAHNSKLTQIYQEWNGVSAWTNHTNYLYSYDANNNLLQQVWQTWDAGTTTWINDTKIAYSYDANGNQLQYTLYSWNTGSSSWYPIDRYTYTYNVDNKQTSYLREDWGGGAYSNSARDTTYYNGSGDAVKVESFSWNAGNWHQGYRYTYVYDGNHNNTYELQENFNLSNVSYEFYDQLFYYYQQFNVAGVNNLKNELGASIFPNPGKEINLQFGVEETSPVTIRVFDAAGRIITTQTQTAASGISTVHLETPNMATGNYFIQLIDRQGKKESVLKFVKE